MVGMIKRHKECQLILFTDWYDCRLIARLTTKMWFSLKKINGAGSKYIYRRDISQYMMLQRYSASNFNNGGFIVFYLNKFSLMLSTLNRTFAKLNLQYPINWRTLNCFDFIFLFYSSGYDWRIERGWHALVNVSYLIYIHAKL